MEPKLIIFSILAISAYLLLIYILFKKLPSVSQSFYEFEQRYGKKYTWVFTVALVLYAFPLMVAGLSITNGNTFQFLMFIAPAGIIFTAVAPRFMDTLTKGVHFGGAGVGIFGGLLSIMLTFNQPYILMLCLFLIALIGWSKLSNKIYWLEFVAIYAIPLVMLFKSLY